jgi:hypothetical protein
MSSIWSGCNPKWREEVIFWYREALKGTSKNHEPQRHRDTEKSERNGRPLRFSRF